MAPPAATLFVSSNAQQLTVSEIKEDLAAGKTSTGKGVNISLARLNEYPAASCGVSGEHNGKLSKKRHPRTF